MVKSFIPKTYKEALNLLAKNKLTIIAGGTDLMVKNKNISGLLPKFKKDLLFIAHLTELDYIKKEKDTIHIGANVTLEKILDSFHTHSLLKEALSIMASPAIRHIGTIGGNIANASPAGDTLPVLYVLNTKIVVKSLDSERTIPINDFIISSGKTILKENELISEIIIPDNKFDYEVFLKVGARQADAISKISFAAIANVSDSIVSDFRVTFGAVGPRIVREIEIENNIIGLTTNELNSRCKEICDSYKKFITPIDDQRSSAVYRKKVSLNLLEKYINSIK